MNSIKWDCIQNQWSMISLSLKYYFLFKFLTYYVPLRFCLWYSEFKTKQFKMQFLKNSKINQKYRCLKSQRLWVWLKYHKIFSKNKLAYRILLRNKMKRKKTCVLFVTLKIRMFYSNPAIIQVFVKSAFLSCLTKRKSVHCAINISSKFLESNSIQKEMPIFPIML